MKSFSYSRPFLLFAVLAFLSFPIAGVFALFVVPVDIPVPALIAGTIAGAALGFIRWPILKARPEVDDGIILKYF